MRFMNLTRIVSVWVMIGILVTSCSQIDNSSTEEDDKSDTVEVSKKVQLKPFSEGNLMGYQNEEGKRVISPQYIIAEEFSNGTAYVLEETGWFLINEKGNVILKPFIFDNGPDMFHEALARFVESQKMGFYNRGGEKIIPAKFDFALPFSQGLAAVCEDCRKERLGEHYHMVGGRWGYINLAGEVVIPLQYDEAESFNEKGKAEVRKGSQWFMINRKGIIQ